MKLLPILCFLALASFARAQSEGAIKATVTVLEDGHHKSTVMNPETHIKEERIEDNKGKLLSRTVYDLDDRNLSRAGTYFDAAGKQLYKGTFTRDSSDRIVEEAFISLAGKLIMRRVYTYGANNKVARLDVYDGNGNLVAAPEKPKGPGRPDKKR